MTNNIDKTPNQLISKGNITFYNIDYSSDIVKPIYIAANEFKKYTELLLILYNNLLEEKKKVASYKELIETEKNSFRNGLNLVLSKKRNSHYGWAWIPTDKFSQLEIVPIKKTEKQIKVNKLNDLSNIKLNINEILRPFDIWFEQFGTLLQKNSWESSWKEIIKTISFLISLNIEEQKSEILLFQKVLNRADMFNFYGNLKNSVYYQLCFFIFKNAIFDNNSYYLEKHHCVLSYLSTSLNHDLPNINKQYNLIKIPLPIHIVLYAIGLVEFQNYNDKYTLLIYLNKVKTRFGFWSEKETILQEENLVGSDLVFLPNQSLEIEKNKVDFRDFLKYTCQAIENNKIFKKLQQKQYQNQLQIVWKRTIKKLHSAFQQSFSKDMIWENKVYKIKIFIPKNTMKVPMDLLNYLKITLNKYIEENPSFKRPYNSNTKESNLYWYLSDYIKGIRQETAFFSWYMNPCNNNFMFKK